MRITFVTRKFGNVERNSHCDVLHITPIRVARLFLDCNGVFAIKAYRPYVSMFFLRANTFVRNIVHPCVRHFRFTLISVAVGLLLRGTTEL